MWERTTYTRVPLVRPTNSAIQTSSYHFLKHIVLREWIRTKKKLRRLRNRNSETNHLEVRLKRNENYTSYRNLIWMPIVLVYKIKVSIHLKWKEILLQSKMSTQKNPIHLIKVMMIFNLMLKFQKLRGRMSPLFKVSDLLDSGRTSLRC